MATIEERLKNLYDIGEQSERINSQVIGKSSVNDRIAQLYAKGEQSQQLVNQQQVAERQRQAEQQQQRDALLNKHAPSGMEYVNGKLQIKEGYEADPVTGFVLPTTEKALENFGSEKYILPASLIQGADQAATGITSTLDWLFGRPLQALGWENNPISALNEKLQSEKEQNRQYFAQKMEGDTSSQALSDIGTQVVAALPDALLASLTAGGSVAAQATTKGLQAASAASKAATGNKIIDAASTAASALNGMVRNPQTWLSFSRVAGPSYDQAVYDGADSVKASAYAVINGLLNTIVEIGGGGIQELPSAVRRGGNALRQWVDTMIDEGKEEAVQGVIERLTQNVVYGKGNPTYSTTDESAALNPVTALKEAGMGALVGGILGGGQIAINNALSGSGVDSDAYSEFLKTAGLDTDVQQNAAPAQPEGVQTGAVQADAAAPSASTLDVLLSGNVTNSVAERIVTDPQLRAEFERRTGIKLEGSKPQMRNAVRSYAEGDAGQFRPETAANDVAEADVDMPPVAPNNVQDIQQSVAYNAPLNEGAGTGVNAVGAAERGFSVGHSPIIAENQRHGVEGMVSPQNLGAPETHEVLPNRDSMYYAQQRVRLDREGEMADLPNKLNWDAVDFDTAGIILQQLDSRANQTKAPEDILAVANWRRLVDRKGSGAGQALQALAKWAKGSNSPDAIVADAAILFATEEARTGNTSQSVKDIKTVSNSIDKAVRSARKGIGEAFEQASQGKKSSKHSGIVEQVEGQISLDLGKAEVNVPAEKIQRDIKSALKDIGTTINKVARGGADTQSLRDQISAVLQQKYGFGATEATNIGDLVNQYFGEMVSKESERVLANIFKERKPSVQKTFEEKLKELINLGAFTNESYSQLAADTLFDESLNLQDPKHRAALSEIYDYATRLSEIADGDAASTIQLIKDLSARRGTDGLIGGEIGQRLQAGKDFALKAIAKTDGGPQFLHDLALSQIRQIANDYRHRSFFDYLLSYRYLNLLSGIGTVMRNLVGNPVFSIVETNSNNLGVLVDTLLSKKTGYRTLAYDKGLLSSAALRSSTEALLKSYLEVGYDADVSGAQSRYGLNNTRTFRMSGNFLERFLSTWEKWSKYALTSTDEFSKGAARGQITEGLTRLQDKGLNVSDEYITNRANEVALERTFQNNSRVASSMRHAQQALDELGGDYLPLGRIAIPFAKIGGNVGTQVVNYSPVSLVNNLKQLVTTLIQSSRGTLTPEQQAYTAMSIGRTVTGTSLIAMFTALALKGILRVASEDDDKNLDRAEGVSGTHFNLSAAWRLLNGESTEWQVGDDIMEIGFLEPINAFMSMGAMLADDYLEADEDGKHRITVKDIALASAATVFQAVSELPAMTGLKDIQDSLEYSEGEEIGTKLVNAGMSYLGGQLSSFIVPNFITNIAEGTDPYMRAPWQADSIGEEIVNEIKADIPGLRQSVPVRQDIWGNDMTYTDNDAMNFINQTVLPGAISTYNTNWANQEIRRLNNYPPKTPTDFTIDNEKISLDQQQQRLYNQTWGQVALSNINALENNPTYASLSDEDKNKVIDSIYEYASAVAKKEINGRYKLEGASAKAEEYGDPAEYFLFNEALQTIEDTRGSNMAAFNAVMEDYENMSAQRQQALMEALGEGTRFDDVVDAYQAGIQPNQWYKAYGKWQSIGEGEGSANDKATEFANWLDSVTNYSAEQSELLQDQMIYYTMIRGNSDRYDELRDLGFTPAESIDLYEYIGEMNKLSSDTDVEGNTIPGSKKAKVIDFIDTLDLTPDEKDLIFSAFTSYKGLEDTPWHNR